MVRTYPSMDRRPLLGAGLAQVEVVVWLRKILLPFTNIRCFEYFNIDYACTINEQTDTLRHVYTFFLQEYSTVAYTRNERTLTLMNTCT